MKKGTTSSLILLLSLTVPLVSIARAPTISPEESTTLFIGDTLILRSDQPAIDRIVIRGNLTAASVSSITYPARNFTLTSNASETYVINAWLTYPGPYTASVAMKSSVDGSTTELPSYYVSSGELNLTLTAVFQPRPGADGYAPVGWSAFYDWVAQFGGAFPLWVKGVFLFLGAQFAFVGYRWVRFEDERRKLEGHLPPLDKGNRAYLWTDILFRGLLTAFAMTLAVMVGEALIILLAEYLFFVDLSIVSLVDFFSLFFIAALASIVYLAREGMDRLLDLKPIMED